MAEAADHQKLVSKLFCRPESILYREIVITNKLPMPTTNIVALVDRGIYILLSFSVQPKLGAPGWNMYIRREMRNNCNQFWNHISEQKWGNQKRFWSYDKLVELYDEIFHFLYGNMHNFMYH